MSAAFELAECLEACRRQHVMQLEICIDRIESALAAQEGGADRLEVCSSLAAGGTTPSRGLVQQCAERCQLELMMMIRPHDGGFCFGSDDLDTMLRDIAVAKELGVHGIVFGVLADDGRVHLEQCRRLLDAARPLQATFHRAFDVARDALEALDDLLEVGVDRILTSGQADTAQNGTSLIRQLVQRSGDRLSVMAGAGINAANVTTLVRETGVHEVHASASVVRRDSRGANLGFGNSSRVTSSQKVRELVKTMQSL